MSAGKRVGLASVCAAVAFGVSGVPAGAGVIQKDEFSITIPDDWAEVPASLLANVRAEAMRQLPNVKVPKYDYAFLPRKLAGRFDYPYILMEIHREGYLPEQSLRSMAQHVSPATAMRDLSGKVPMLHPGVNISAVYDSDANMIWVRARETLEGSGTIATLSGVIPTATGFIQMTGSAMDAEFKTYEPIFRDGILSITLSPAMAYTVTVTSMPPSPPNRVSDGFGGGTDWGPIALRVLVAAVVGGLIGFAVKPKKKRD